MLTDASTIAPVAATLCLSGTGRARPSLVLLVARSCTVPHGCTTLAGKMTEFGTIIARLTVTHRGAAFALACVCPIPATPTDLGVLGSRGWTLTGGTPVVNSALNKSATVLKSVCTTILKASATPIHVLTPRFTRRGWCWTSAWS